MAKYFQIPFAMNGDRKEIPTDKQDDGSISFDEGYGADYEKNKQVDPTAKDISRQEFNSVLHDITGAIGEIQRSGVATWTNEISYSKGATIIHNGAVYTSTINANKNEPPHASWSSLDLSVYRKKDDLTYGDGSILTDADIVREWGDSPDKVLSQKFLTDMLKPDTVTVVVGNGGFRTLQEAVNHILSLPDTGVKYEIMIESGFKIKSSTVFNNAVLGHVVISSEDDEVFLDEMFPNDEYILRGVNSSFPIFNILINANERAIGGISVNDNSKIYVKRGKGVHNSHGSGISVIGSSLAFIEGSIFKDNVRGGGIGSGITSWSSITYANEADVSGSGFYGAQASAGGILNFRSGNADNCQAYGVRATNVGIVNCPYVTAKNCGKTGIRAFDGGVVEARFSDSSGCGESNISVSGCGRIIASNSISDKAKGVAVIAVGGDAVLTETTFNDCEGEIFNINGANIYANSIVASTSITNKNAINIRNSMVTMISATISGGFKGVNIYGSSSVDMRNATVSNALSVGVDIYESSNVNGEDSKVIDYGIRGFQVRDASSVNLKGAIANKINSNQGENTDVLVSFGGIVSLHNSNNGSNISPNTLSSNGIIFK